MTAKYFIFDMDETLAELYSVYYFIATLRLKRDCDNADLCKNLPVSLLKGLDGAYDIFVDKILREEISNNKLGILRPGVLNVMKKLSEMQKQGKIKNVVIYSNNGHLESLEFIRDLIHKYIKNDKLIKECIHWNHPMRNEETMGQPGAANKTWNVLRNILIKGNCGAPNSIESSEVYFFDDLDHRDLMSNLGDNYYQVPGYNFKASFDRLADIFKFSLRELDKNDKEILKNVVISLFGDTDFLEASDDIIVNIFRSKTKGTVGLNVLPAGPDSGIEMMNIAIEKVLMQKGGKNKKRSGTKKSIVKRIRAKSRVRKN